MCLRSKATHIGGFEKRSKNQKTKSEMKTISRLTINNKDITEPRF